ncbi:MAG: hypothetical protein QNJ40_25430 [Xanthomonadales bacterium]|nr:hypothetical protein [Xanthomonadales bacterium]
MNILSSLKGWFALVLAFLFVTGCTTVDRVVRTPAGPVAQVDGPLSILRVVRKTSTTGNMPDARDGVVNEVVVISCPAFTETAVPIVQSVARGFGGITPDDLSAVDANGSLSFTYSDTSQRPLGISSASVAVSDVDAPDSAGEQRVTLQVGHFLSDENFDDRWFQVVTYTVLCLGNQE